MVEFLIGTALAVIIAIFARVTKFDTERSFYSTILIVIASYYVLFSFMSLEAIAIEIVIASAFSVVAIIGALKRPLLLGLGIFMHGVFDLAHGSFITNSGVPVWWPAFCAGVDLVLGAWVIYLTQVKKVFESENA